MSDDGRIMEFEICGDDGEKTIVTMRRGERVQRFECDTSVILCANDGDSRVWTSLSGDVALLGRLFAQSIVMASKLELFPEALAVSLARDYNGTAREIARAFTLHGNWRKKHGEAERDRGDDAGSEGGPGPRGT